MNNLSHCRMLNFDCLERAFVTASRLMCSTSCFSKTVAYFSPSQHCVNTPECSRPANFQKPASAEFCVPPEDQMLLPRGCPMRWVLSHGSMYRCCCSRCGPVGCDLPFMLHLPDPYRRPSYAGPMREFSQENGILTV